MFDLKPVYNMLDASDVTALTAIGDELKDTWEKRKKFRTETEARISVLNDGSHPTNAAKYWQAVAEQAVMFDNLVMLTFDLRRNEVAFKRAQQKLAQAKKEVDIEDAQIDVDECVFKRASGAQVAQDRVREIRMWSKLKAELDDGSFDTQDVNTHQAEAMLRALQNRAVCLTQGSSQSEVLNVLGPLQSAQAMSTASAMDNAVLAAGIAPVKEPVQLELDLEDTRPKRKIKGA